MKILSTKEEEKLNNQELIEYYRELREYLKNIPYDNFRDIGIDTREKVNILTKKILKVILKYDVQIDGYENMLAVIKIFMM